MSKANQQNLAKVGEQVFNKVEKVVCKININSQIYQNGELVSLMYGALVVQMLKDYEDVEEVNKQLEKMYNFFKIFYL